MKIPMPQLYAVFGPVGLPYARVVAVGLDEHDTKRQAVLRLEDEKRMQVPEAIPFDPTQSLPINGYLVGPVTAAGELKPSEAVRVPGWFRPAASNSPGRALSDFPHWESPYLNKAAGRFFVEGDADCDHDFGLERHTFSYDAQVGGHVHKFVCTRCAAVYGIPEQDD